MTTEFIMGTLIYVISMEFLPSSHRLSSGRNVPSGEERGERLFSQAIRNHEFNFFLLSQATNLSQYPKRFQSQLQNFK